MSKNLDSKSLNVPSSLNNKIVSRLLLNRDPSLFGERKTFSRRILHLSPRLPPFSSRFRSGWISSSRALKSGNAWLRHLKKTPRESAFSRADTRCRFHTGRPLPLKLFSTSGRRPTSRARGRPPKRDVASISNRPFSLPSFLPFEPNLHHTFFAVHHLYRPIDPTDLPSLIRIHSRTFPTHEILALHPTSFNGFSRRETFVEFQRRAPEW